MEYVALKECNFDRVYSPGEKIGASAIDASIVQGALAHGYIGVDAPDDVSALRKQIEEKDAEIEQLNKRADEAEKALAELRAQLEAAKQPDEADGAPGTTPDETPAEEPTAPPADGQPDEATPAGEGEAPQKGGKGKK